MPASKFTPEARATIVQAIRDCNYRGIAAKLAGISPDTFYEWMQMGRNEPEKYPEHATFVAEIELAEAEAESELIGVVQKTALSGSPNTWQAAMTILERKYPDRYGRRDTTVLEGGENPIRQLTGVVVVNDNERGNPRAILEGLARRRELQSERLGDDRQLEAGESK